MSDNYQLFLFSGLTILMWGIWGFFGKMAIQRHMSPIAIFLAEVVLGAVCAIPVLIIFLRKQNTLPLQGSWNIFGLASGAGLAIGLLFYYLALERQQVSIVVPLTATYPVVSVLLSYIVLRERPSLSQCIGILLIVVGTTLLLSGSVIKVLPK